MNREKLAGVLEKLREHPSSAEWWEELYRLLWPFLLAKMYRRIGGNRYLAEEASQETMLRIVRYFDFNGPDATVARFLRYLTNTCNSVLIDLLRVSKRTPTVSTESDEIEYLANARDPLPNPEQRAILQSTLEKLVQGLSPREREIIYLLMQGKTPHEIAEATGIEGKTVANAVSSLRGKCRKVLFQQSETPSRE